MSTIVGIAGSPLPNAIAVASALAVLLVGLSQRKQRPMLGTQLIFVTIASLSAVAAKNVAYHGIIRLQNAENDPSARRLYATLLLIMAILQMVIALTLLIDAATVQWPSWVLVFASLAHVWAALSMLDWRQAYLSVAATEPVEFRVWLTEFSWVVVAFLAVSLLAALVELVRRRPNRRKR